jgi:hypothetical protein
MPAARAHVWACPLSPKGLHALTLTAAAWTSPSLISWPRNAPAPHAGAAMMAQVASGNEVMDLTLAGLYVCSEDDATKTRTHIPLPVDAFSERLDNMVAVRKQPRRRGGLCACVCKGRVCQLAPTAASLKTP